MWTAKEIKQPYMIAYGPGVNVDDAMVRQFAEAGANILQMNDWHEVSEAKRVSVSQIAQKYHVGLLPWGFFDSQTREPTLRKWSPDPSIFGWFMWDEPGRDEPYPLSLRQQVAQQMRDYTGGQGKLVSIWDDPVWGVNIGPGLADIVGYAVAYPFEHADIANPLAWTTARCNLYGYGGGALQKAREAGMLVIPVLQSWVKKVVVPDILGQYQAYLNCFPFDPSAYLYDPSNHIVKVPEVKALVQQLTVQLGGTLWEPTEEFTTQEITCSGCGARLELTMSSIPEKNVSQGCPVCGTPAD